MADSKGNGSPNERTSRREVLNFPEVIGKTVESVEVFSDHEYYAISIRFQDKTALQFPLETAVFAFPSLSDWKDGNETVLKEYKSVRSRVQRL